MSHYRELRGSFHSKQIELISTLRLKKNTTTKTQLIIVLLIDATFFALDSMALRLDYLRITSAQVIFLFNHIVVNSQK